MIIVEQSGKRVTIRRTRNIKTEEKGGQTHLRKVLDIVDIYFGESEPEVCHQSVRVGGDEWEWKTAGSPHGRKLA